MPSPLIYGPRGATMKHGISELPTTYRRSEKLLAHITRWLITKIGRFFRFSAQSEIYLRWIWVTSWNLHDVSSSASSQKTNPNPKSTSLKPPVLLEEKHRSNTQQTAPAVGGSFRALHQKKGARAHIFTSRPGISRLFALRIKKGCRKDESLETES